MTTLEHIQLARADLYTVYDSPKHNKRLLALENADRHLGALEATAKELADAREQFITSTIAYRRSSDTVLRYDMRSVVPLSDAVCHAVTGE